MSRFSCRVLGPLISGLFLCAMLVAGCPGPAGEGDVEEQRSDQPRDLAPDVGATDLDELVSGNSAFALDLFGRLAAAESGNVFLSPFSVSAALVMCYAGARDNTANEMAEVLHFTLDPAVLHPAWNALNQTLASRGTDAQGTDDDGFRLHVANAIWAQQGYQFLPEYLDVLALHHGAGIYLVDYAVPDLARVKINGWVGVQTEGRIPDLIGEGTLSPDTSLVLTNTIYFNAAWAKQFDAANTHDGAFHLEDGGQVTVPLMARVGDYPYAREDGVQVVELPYDGQDLSMVVFLPDVSRFQEIAQSLDGTTYTDLTGLMSDTFINLTLPRFTINTRTALSETLMDMGMVDAFDDADFSGMDGSRNLQIGTVIHQAFVEVSEEGTEAAAATAVTIDGGAGVDPPQPVEVAVDRPFLFVIRDRPTGTVLFIGRVMQP